MESKANKTEKAIVFSQILLLVVAVFAFAWIIGGSFKNVSAGNDLGGSDCASFTVNSQAYTGVCKDYGVKKSTYAKNQCPKDIPGSSYIPGHCPGATYCCATPKVKDKENPNGGSSVSKTDIKNILEGILTKWSPKKIPSTTPNPVQDKSTIEAAENAANKKATGDAFFNQLMTPKNSVEKVAKTGETYIGRYTQKQLSSLSAKQALQLHKAGLLTDTEYAASNTGLLGSGYSATTLAGAAAVAVGFSYLGQQIGGTGAVKDLMGAAIGSGATAGYLLLVAGGITPVGWGIIAATFVTNLFIKHTKEQGVVYFYCQPWDATVGGKNCHLCNERFVGGKKLPCTEYMCKSLGQNCEFVQSDPEKGGESFCFHNNTNDIQPPKINASVEALSPGYKYVPFHPIPSYPEDRGVIIKDPKSSDGCISPFSKLTFGVNLNEYAKCKIDFQRPVDYESMTNYMGEGIRGVSLNQTIVVPTINNSLGKDNLLNLFVRCQDLEGNADPNDFVFQMCVQEGPDTRLPKIDFTSPENGAQIPHNQTSAKVDFYISEPANCKWDFKDVKYDEMSYNMTCATDPVQLNDYLDYTCSANLTGIKSTTPTTYFVRCRDQPNAPPNVTKNTNSQSYKYSLKSSDALVIYSVSPNNTEIRDSTNPSLVTIKAKTIGGTYDGRALCYSKGDSQTKYTVFDNSGNSSVHSTIVAVSTNGEHIYYIKCIDGAGNSDTEKINFKVSIDTSPPRIARAYYDNGNLKFITNEEANCAYSTSGCDFTFNVNQNDGVAIDNGVLQTDHLVDWRTDTDLHIKCLDSYGNGPSTGTCTMSLRAEDKFYL